MGFLYRSIDDRSHAQENARSQRVRVDTHTLYIIPHVTDRLLSNTSLGAILCKNVWSILSIPPTCGLSSFRLQLGTSSLSRGKGLGPENSHCYWSAQRAMLKRYEVTLTKIKQRE